MLYHGFEPFNTKNPLTNGCRICDRHADRIAVESLELFRPFLHYSFRVLVRIPGDDGPH
jgi:hypothetical protein